MMELKHLGLAALWTAVALSVPHGMYSLECRCRCSYSPNLGQNHKNLHEKRVLVTDTTVITSIITVTSPSVVVWVDEQGNVVSTETRGLTPSTVSSATPTTSTSSYLSTTVSNTFSSSITSTSSYEAITLTIPSSVAVETPSSPSSAPVETPATSSPLPVATPTGARVVDAIGLGVCYDLMASDGGCRTAEVMDTEFAYLATQGFAGVRVYDVGCNVATAASKAAAHGLKLFAGINHIDNVVADLGKLVGWMNGDWSSIDTINIGNEVVNNGGSVSAVVAAVQQARGILSAAGYKGKIVTVDTFNAHLANPDLCAASDYCAANAHAFFNSDTPAEKAGTYVMSVYNDIVAKSGGKSVVITESGWPYAGNSNGAAVPSRENQQAAIASIKQSFASIPGNMFLFQAYDASYKPAGYLDVERHFGLYAD